MNLIRNDACRMAQRKNENKRTPSGIALAPTSRLVVRNAYFRSKVRKSKLYKWLDRACWSAVCAPTMLMTIVPANATAGGDIWSKLSSMVQDVYGKLLGISTIVAVTAATVALMVRMISRNQRAVDEATSWLKRIVVTWLVLNTLGFAVAYLQPLVQGGQYTG